MVDFINSSSIVIKVRQINFRFLTALRINSIKNYFKITELFKKFIIYKLQIYKI